MRGANPARDINLRVRLYYYSVSDAIFPNVFLVLVLPKGKNINSNQISLSIVKAGSTQAHRKMVSRGIARINTKYALIWLPNFVIYELFISSLFLMR